jgi:hypothetical protein
MYAHTAYRVNRLAETMSGISNCAVAFHRIFRFWLLADIAASTAGFCFDPKLIKRTPPEGGAQLI